MSELLNLSNSIATSKANILSALEDRGVTVSEATKLEDVPELINNMVVSGTGDNVLATNLTGSNITVGDKVYLKQQVAQQEGQDTQFNNNACTFAIINTAGTKIFYYQSSSYEYDIASSTKQSILNLTSDLANRSVVKYEGEIIFVNGYMITTGIVASPVYRYAQDHYAMSWSNGDIVKYNDDFTTVLQTWTLSGLSDTNDIMEACVVGNKLYIIKFEGYYVKAYSGVINEESQSITLTEVDSSSTNSTFFGVFCFNRLKAPVVTTLDNKIGFCGNYEVDSWGGNTGNNPGLRIVVIDNSYDVTENFVTQNSDLTEFISSAKNFTFNRGTNILTCRSDNKYGIFKYNPATIDFDTLLVDSMSAWSQTDKYLSVCNDVSRLCYSRYYRNMEVAAGGYNAIPYSMGQDIITGFALEAAEPNDTFNVNTVVS